MKFTSDVVTTGLQTSYAWFISIFSDSKTDQQGRINQIFNQLHEHEAYREIWNLANLPLHQQIEIKPSNLCESNVPVTTGMFKIVLCSNECSHKTPKQTTPHSFIIAVNASNERTDDEIARTIIFETVNASRWRDHCTLAEKHRNKRITTITHSTESERIEFKVLGEAARIGDKINCAFFQDVTSEMRQKFAVYLEHQTVARPDGTSHLADTKKLCRSVHRRHKFDSCTQLQTVSKELRANRSFNDV